MMCPRSVRRSRVIAGPQRHFAQIGPSPQPLMPSVHPELAGVGRSVWASGPIPREESLTRGMAGTGLIDAT
jgi:hypothetical protein